MRARRLIASTSALLAAASGAALGDAYDPPANYYSTATSTNGATLKGQLYSIISANFTGQSYGDARYIMGSGDAANAEPGGYLDQDPNNSNNIVLVYNRASVSGQWDQGTTWNREHVWPKHWLNLTSSQVDNTYTGIASDLFELRPADPNVNSARGDNAYGWGSYTGTYGTNTASDGSGTYWYPGDADRGDVARSIFYMATRYGQNQAHNLTIVNDQPATYQMGDLQTLLKWNYTDPVGTDPFERRRNQYIYSNPLHADYSQGNRNPFIDHPEYVWAIFGGGNNDSQLHVGSSVNADGSSATTANIRAIKGSAFGTVNVTLTKTGTAPTTFDVTTTGSATSTLGLRQGIDYSNQTKTIAIGSSIASSASAASYSGTVLINNTDITNAGAGKGSNDAADTVNVTISALEHSQASFNPSSDSDALTIDFGYAPANFANRTLQFPISNLPTGSAALTASLDIDTATRVSGSSTRMSVAGVAGTSIAAGATQLYTATYTPGATSGPLTSTFNIGNSDENIPGATNGTTVVLTTTARTFTTATFPASGYMLLLSGETLTTTGTTTIQAGVTLDKQGPGVWNINGSQNHGATSALTISGGDVSFGTDAGSIATRNLAVTLNSGAGNVTFNSSQHLRGLTVNGGVAALAANGARVLVADALTTSGTGKLDLNDNDAIVKNAQRGDVQTLIASAYNAGSWNGSGITSSTAAANANQTTALAVIQASDAGYTSFDSETVTASDVLVKYTWVGDANLDGTVGFDDFQDFLQGFSGTSAANWFSGDFNYSGAVTFDDFSWYLAGLNAFNSSGTVLSPMMRAEMASFATENGEPLVMNSAPAPEPAVCALLAVAPLLIRRRRKG